MLSRWYVLFVGFLLIVAGIAALVTPNVLGRLLRPTEANVLMATGVVWLVTAVVSFVFGFGVRSIEVVRWYAGIMGGLYFLWGIIQLFSAPGAAGDVLPILLAGVAGVVLLLGSLGLGSALVPAPWMHPIHTEPMAA